MNGKAIEKCGFCHRFEFNIPPFSLDSSSQVWHLWQQKNNIAVGRRTHTRAREKASWSGHFVQKNRLVCNVRLSLCVCCKEKSAVFCGFFTLCPYFHPYIFRGWWVRKGAKRGRTEKGSSMRPIEKWVWGIMPPFRVSSSERKWRGRRASKDQRVHPKQPREELCTTRAQE